MTVLIITLVCKSPCEYRSEWMRRGVHVRVCGSVQSAMIYVLPSSLDCLRFISFSLSFMSSLFLDLCLFRSRIYVFLDLGLLSYWILDFMSSWICVFFVLGFMSTWFLDMCLLGSRIYV